MSFDDAGPHVVGVVTLDIRDRKVDVYYPARPGSDKRAESTNPRFPTYPDVPAGKGRFPVVLFAHGLSATRDVNARLLAGIASWGFVVASTDYHERGFDAVSNGTMSWDVRNEVAVSARTLDRLDEADRGDGRLAGHVDTDRVGAVGHSAGGGTALGLIGTPGVRAVVGWAPAQPPESPELPRRPVPSMVIVAARDLVITPDSARSLYRKLAPPKRLAVIGEAGHNSFSDVCAEIYDGRIDVVQQARAAGIDFPEVLLRLGQNGCEPDDLDPRTAWRVTQHLTVAHLRAALGIDDEAVGLTPAALAKTFPDVRIEYEEEEEEV